MSKNPSTWNQRISGLFKRLGDAAGIQEDAAEDETLDPDTQLAVLDNLLLAFAKNLFPGLIEEQIGLFESAVKAVEKTDDPEERQNLYEVIMASLHETDPDMESPFTVAIPFDLGGHTYAPEEIFALNGFRRLVKLCDEQGLYMSFHTDENGLMDDEDLEYLDTTNVLISGELLLEFKIGTEPLQNLKSAVEAIPGRPVSLIAEPGGGEGPAKPAASSKGKRGKQQPLRLIPKPAD